MIISNLIILNRKSLEKRSGLEEANRIVYCIMQEIKYNMSFEEVISEVENNNLCFSKSEELLEKLRFNDLKTLERGSDIIIKINKNLDDIKVTITLSDVENDIFINREFTKSKWMDYYE